ncbi:MAG: DUF309 domain-containing protein, partial [Gammaproteobacteria bacterium]
LPRRYCARPFPPYRFVPGRNPHPLRDPKGHSYGLSRPVATRFEPSQWRTSTDYLYGVDLFNSCYWWEAHETWEGIWVAVGRRTPMGQFMQGLIQISVAHLKRFQGLGGPADRLLREGFARMRRSGGTFLGIEIEIFEREVEAYFTGTRAIAPLIQLVGFSAEPQAQETLSRL